MPEEFTYKRLTGAKARGKVADAALQYMAPREEPMSTISSKNQITLPAHVLRQVGLGPGDRLAIAVEGSRLVLRARPKDWVQYHAGSLPNYYGQSREEIDAYVRELRDDEEREEQIERAWTGTEPAP